MHEVVVLAGQPSRDLLARRLFDPVIVSTHAELAQAMARRPFLAFVDTPNLPAVEGWAERVPIVAIVEESLATAGELLERHPWLSHVIGASLLQAPTASEHLGALYATLQLAGTDLRPFVGGVVKGRFARLLQSTSRPGRVERLGRYLEGQGVSARKVQLLRDVAEELVTNAFYDAPAAAGLVGPIPRTQDVILTGPYSCELAYGVRGDNLVFVRVRDLFGSFTRARLVEVLRRCGRADANVTIDESMGGAGLGLWRIFSAASFVAISVVEKVSCDILVGVYPRAAAPQSRRPDKETCSIHLFFDVRATEPAEWGDADGALDADDENDELERSVALRI